MDKTTIFVRLLDENVGVCRPVDAIEERPGCYRILGPAPDPDAERWEFQPRQLVRCKLDDGGMLVAVDIVG
jgi:hypothetical protein